MASNWQATYQRLADLYNDRSRQLYRHIVYYYLLKVGGSESSILDCGFGAAGTARNISENKLQIDYTGIDNSVTFCGKAQSLYGQPNIKFVCGDMKSLPFTNNVFDIVTTIGTLHLHARKADIETPIMEMSRVCNGYLVFGFGMHHDDIHTCIEELTEIVYITVLERVNSKKKTTVIVSRPC